MSEIEKKAIERIKDTFYQDLGKGINKFQKITLYEDDITDIRKLLNLIEKQQAKIEQLKEYIKENKIYKRNLFEAYERQRKEIEELKEKSKYYEEELDATIEQSVSKHKIKAKIKELEKNMKSDYIIDKVQKNYILLSIIKTLKDLLEGE